MHFRFPDVPPRDFELRILKWVGGPLCILLAIAFQLWACEVGSERSACEFQCETEGAEGFIYVPANGCFARGSECICRMSEGAPLDDGRAPE